MPARKPSFRPQVETLEAREVPSFGTGGFVSTNLAHTTSETTTEVALQADGKIVAVGIDGLARYNADGSLDTTFNGGGTQPGVVPITDPLYDVAVQADGKIVVGGSRIVKEYKKSGPDRAFVLMRFNANGTLDATFGTGGTVVQAFGKSTASDGLRSLAIQADGKIVTAGLINSNGWGNTNPDMGNWGVARFNANGTLDTTFDGDGFLATALVANQAATARAVAVQSDGKIVVGGDVVVDSTRRLDAAVVRYLSTGALDTSFGGTGKVLIDFSSEFGSGAKSADQLNDLVIQSDGRVVFAGYCSGVSGITGSPGLMGRLNVNGSLDATFGGDGRVVVLPPYYNGSNISRHVMFVNLAIQPDGKVVAWSPSFSQSNMPSTVVRVNADGSLDGTFGDSGIAFLQWPGGTQSDGGVGGMAIQSDGKIIVGGGHFDSVGNYFDLARLNTDGSFDI